MMIKKTLYVRIFTLFLCFLLSVSIPTGNANNLQKISHINEDWWHHWIRDKNHNGIDDLIDSKIKNGLNSSVNIFVDYDYKPTQKDVKILNQFNVNVTYVCKYINTVCVTNASLQDIIAISKLPHVIMIEKQGEVKLLQDISVRTIKARPSDVYSPNTVWELGYTGRGVNIAMLDSGVDDEHESLKGKFVAGVDVTEEGTTKPKDGTYNPDDKAGHGTGCASIAMGTGGSEDTYKGVAPDAKLIDVRCFYKPTDRNLAQYFVKGIEWCIQHKDEFNIDIISISAGDEDYTDGSDAWSREMDKAVEQGFIVVYATGNDGPDNEAEKVPSPDNAISVGAIDDKNTVDRNNDEIADFSSRGPRADNGDDDPYNELKPDVVAPGVDIISAAGSIIGMATDKYGTWSGTSCSAPHVSGIVALMLEANAQLTPKAVKQILQETAEQKGVPEHPDYPYPYNKWNRSYGCGYVDAYEAVKAALAWTPPPEPNILPSISIASPKNNAEVSGIITISGMALDTDGSVTNVELKIDDDNWFNVSIVSANSLEWNYSWDTKNVENDKHTIYARCFDAENWSEIVSVDVNVYNKVSTGGGEEETKINPIYLISGAGIIGAVVIIVVCVLFFRRKKMHGAVSAVPPPVTGIPSVTAQCPTCGNIIKILSGKRPLKIRCSKCGARSILR